MKRKEKNNVLKRAGDMIDLLITSQSISAEQIAECINILKEIDQGMYLKHDDRKYHAAIKAGKIILEKFTER